MRRLRLTLPATAAALIALATPATGTTAAPSPCRGAHLDPAAADAATVRAATLCLLNRERARRRLPRLHSQRALGRAAGGYARLMVRQGFFAHVAPDGSTLVQRIRRTRYLHGVRGWSLGENLAWGAGAAASPARIVHAWMHSPGHRRNILDRHFREIGVGLASHAPGRGDGATYVTEFGARAR